MTYKITSRAADGCDIPVDLLQSSRVEFDLTTDSYPEAIDLAIARLLAMRLDGWECYAATTDLRTETRPFLWYALEEAMGEGIVVEVSITRVD